jgi:hypothetical protein
VKTLYYLEQSPLTGLLINNITKELINMQYTFSIKKLIITLLFFTMLYLLPAKSFALISNVNITPKPAEINEIVTIQFGHDCTSWTVDLGDGDSIVDAFTAPNPNVTLIHDYLTAGTFTVTITAAGCLTAGTQVTLTTIIQTLPNSPITVEDIQLYFDNNQSLKTIDNGEKISAFARINYTGTGHIQGHWEVDGNIFSQISLHVSQGQTAKISLPGQPPLPTYKQGQHEVKLIINNPVVTIQPKIIYTVKKDKKININLVSPIDKNEIRNNSINFSWNTNSPADHYQITINDTTTGKEAFSAVTSTRFYHLQNTTLESFLNKKNKYSWKITALNKKNRILNKSNIYNFYFKKQKKTIPRQILVISKASKTPFRRNSYLEKKYKIKPLHSYKLKSINYQVTLYRASQDILRLIPLIKSEKDIIDVQTNNIFKVMSEPFSKLQHIHNTLSFDKLHKTHKGNKVKIAIIDTGIDVKHKDIASNIKFYKNYVNNSNYKAELHGTAIAGLIGAKINGIGITGVAPLSSLYSYRACKQTAKNNPKAQCSTSWLAKALDAAIQDNMQIINMSFGTNRNDPLLSRLLTAGKRKNIIFVAPVGNDKELSDLAFPANHADVISVAGFDNNKAYPSKVLASKATIVAPADQLFTTALNDKYNFFNGTSMSSAIITGILALAIEKKSTLDLEQLPYKTKDLCQWQEKLLGMTICKH